jgi:ankyrin repeat protein
MGGICTSAHVDSKSFQKNLIKLAAAGKAKEITLLISEGADLNLCDRSGRSALHLACSEGHLDVVRLLVGAGCTLEKRDRWGNYPLKEAIMNGHMEIKDILLMGGTTCSDELKTELEGKLRNRVRVGDLSAVKSLIKCGVSFSAADHTGKTPLHIAAEAGHLLIVVFLISKGADTNKVDNHGRTALDLVIVNKDRSLQDILSSAGVVHSARRSKKTTNK